MEHDDLVTVYTLQDAMQAEIIKNYLESEGIPCAIGNENQAGFTGIFEVDILVRAEDSDRAEHLIRQHLERNA